MKSLDKTGDLLARAPEAQFNFFKMGITESCRTHISRKTKSTNTKQIRTIIYFKRDGEYFNVCRFGYVRGVLMSKSCNKKGGKKKTMLLTLKARMTTTERLNSELGGRFGDEFQDSWINSIVVME